MTSQDKTKIENRVVLFLTIQKIVQTSLERLCVPRPESVSLTASFIDEFNDKIFESVVLYKESFSESRIRSKFEPLIFNSIQHSLAVRKEGK